jgi:hypothetical protein
VHDWVWLDALYRSRSLELPNSGESMAPCLDLVNHSSRPSAYFEENKNNEVVLLLRKGCAVSPGQEITIDYGHDKSAAEMLFSYGFIDVDGTAKNAVFPLHQIDEDPLMKAKLHVFGAPPMVRVEDAEDGIPHCKAPFVYMMCINEEDGLQLRITQDNDGSQHLVCYWQGEDVTNKTDTFESLISSHELRHIFELRAVVIIQEQLQQQLATLTAPADSGSQPGIVRGEVRQTALRLRTLELDLIQRAWQALEDKVSPSSHSARRGLCLEVEAPGIIQVQHICDA